MTIGIAAATTFEIQPTINFLHNRDYLIDSHTFEIVITGIGSVATAYNLSSFIYQRKPAYIVQAGIGGTFTEKFEPGQVVIICDEVMGDLGVAESQDFRDIFDLGLSDPSSTPFMHKRLINPYLADCNMELPFANGLTVNEITTSSRRIELLVSKYNCEIESMEGAACHYVCLQEQIRFIQLRAVSNYIGDRNKKNWKLQLSIENLNHQLINIIQQIATA